MAALAESPPSLRVRVLVWAERRLPALTRLKQPEALPIRLDRRRIYVLPTRFGLGFAALLFVMLLGGLNYGNNPAILLTCVLGAAAWMSLFVGFRGVSGLALIGVHAGECHAGEHLKLALAFAPDLRLRPSLQLRRGNLATAFALPAGGDRTIELDVPAERRGWFRTERIRLWTTYPLGLFQVWSWLNPDLPVLVYARPERPAPPLPAGSGEVGELAASGVSEEHAGLRDYRTSDPPRLIAWKASARHDSLLVRESERRAGTALMLDYAILGALDHEARIERLTAWVLAAEAERRVYTLVLPAESIGPGLGAAQRQACLRALALLPHASD